MISSFLLVIFGLPVFAQFVESPEVSEVANVSSIESGLRAETIFDVLILISALLFIISMFGFGVGFLKMVTSGGDEITAEAGSNMLVLSAWILASSAFGYLAVNLVKYFIY